MLDAHGWMLLVFLVTGEVEVIGPVVAADCPRLVAGFADGSLTLTRGDSTETLPVLFAHCAISDDTVGGSAATTPEGTP